MNRIFSSIFSRKPDGDKKQDIYIYRVPWYEQKHSFAQREESSGDTEDAFINEHEKHTAQSFKKAWKQRSPFGEFVEGKDCDFSYYLKGSGRDHGITQIIDRIVKNKIPFMDIASGKWMGLAPYILQQNKEVPCLITDIDSLTMRSLCKYVKTELSEYDINFASFDNLEMPIQDNMLEFVTGIDAVMFSSVGKTYYGEYEEFATQCERRLLSEVYRILKPGGRFITVESDTNFVYKPEEIQRYFEKHTKFMGMYPKEVIVNKLELWENYRSKKIALKQKMSDVGFQLETEKTYSTYLPETVIAQYFSQSGAVKPLGEYDQMDCKLIRNIRHQTIYVLQKPRETERQKQ